MLRPGPARLSYRATLDVPVAAARTISGWLTAHRKAHDIRTDRVAAHNPDTGCHMWYSGKHKAFGGNVQVLTDPTGYPVWASPVEPGTGP
ncbi:hypothetical protein [Actinomyces capricornis]|uniref:hypothetical protein n=1 Tax=Actinomyces capricornis TaxID=2755559 RepID=UPI003570EE58